MNHHPLSGGLLPDQPDDDLLYRVGFYAPFTVACGLCKQPRGWDCRSSGGYTVGFHKGRIKAVAHLTAQEKYRAFAELRAAHVQRRAETEAALAKPLTAAQQATRAAISEAFRQAKAEFRVKERAMYARCRDPWIHNEACRCREGVPYVAPAPKPRIVREVTDLAAVRARKAGVR